MCFNHWINERKSEVLDSVSEYELNTFLTEYKKECGFDELTLRILFNKSGKFEANKLKKLLNSSLLSFLNQDKNMSIFLTLMLLRYFISFICCPETTKQECRELLDIIFDSKLEYKIYLNNQKYSWINHEYFTNRKYIDENGTKFFLLDRDSFEYFIFTHICYMHLLRNESFNKTSIFNIEHIKKLHSNTEEPMTLCREKDIYNYIKNFLNLN